MTLQIGALTHSGWSDLMPLWQALGWNPDNKEKVEQWFHETKLTSQGPVVLVHRRAELILAQALQAGMPPEQALKQWQQQAENVQDFYKSNRRQTWVVDAQSLLSDPAAIDTLCQTLELDKPSGLVLPEALSIPSADHVLIATQLVRQNQSVCRLMAKLEACTLPLSDNSLSAPVVDLDAVLTNLKRSYSQQKALQSSIQQQADQAKQLNNQQSELTTLKEKLNENSTALSEQQTENQLLIQQLQLVQEALEKQILGQQALEREHDQMTAKHQQTLAQAQQKIERLQNKLKQITSSRAWKVAAPVRAVGRTIKRTPPDIQKLKKQTRQLQASKYFDGEWYLSSYPDVADSAMEPAAHYLQYGASEGRNPSAEFDTNWYLQTYQDVSEAGLNPLIHFLDHGQAEGRAPNPAEHMASPMPAEDK